MCVTPSVFSFLVIAESVPQNVDSNFRLSDSDAGSLSPYNSFTASVSQLSLDNRSFYSNGVSYQSSTIRSDFSSRSWGKKSNGPDLASFQSSIDHILLTPKLFEHKPRADPRDHTRLKEAWDEMIRKRRLTPRATAILPTYLPTSFVDVQAQHILRIPLPSNSPTRHDDDDCNPISSPNRREHFDVDSTFDTAGRSPRATTWDQESSGTSTSSKGANSSWASMHLARTVHTVIGCKEAIWDAFQDLFYDKLSTPPISKSSRVKDIKDADNSRGLRDRFESDWLRWERWV